MRSYEHFELATDLVENQIRKRRNFKGSKKDGKVPQPGKGLFLEPARKICD